MRLIGTYQSRQVFWFDYDEFQLDQLPKKDWLCLAISDIEPNNDKYKSFVRYSISNEILEFKGHEILGEKRHNISDELMDDIEISKKIDVIDIVTTSHNNEPLAHAF